MTLASKYSNTRPIGVLCLSNWGGLEILDMEPDTVVAAFNFGTRTNVRHHKIHHAPKKGPYLIKGGRRYYFQDIMRV